MLNKNEKKWKDNQKLQIKFCHIDPKTNDETTISPTSPEKSTEIPNLQSPAQLKPAVFSPQNHEDFLFRAYKRWREAKNRYKK